MDAKISSDFWGDPAIEALDRDQKLAALYAITNERTTMFGFLEVTAKRFEFDTGCSYQALIGLPEAHPKGFKKCGEGIWIRRFIAHQIGTGAKLVANLMSKPLLKELRALQALPVFEEVLAEYPELRQPYEVLFIQSPELPLGRASQAQERRGEAQSREVKSPKDAPAPANPSLNTPAAPGENSISKKKERGGADPLLMRAKRLFWRDGRREMPETFVLDSAEERAWKKNAAVVAVTPEEDWRLLEWAYAQTQGDAAEYRRTQLSYLLNNWNGELHASRTWAKKAGALGSIVKPSAPAIEAPEGWESAAEKIWPGCDVSRGFSALTGDAQMEIREFLATQNQTQKP